MRLRLRLIGWGAIAFASLAVRAQNGSNVPAAQNAMALAVAELPDAPNPQAEAAGQSGSTTDQQSSSSQVPAPQGQSGQTQQQKAQQQVKEEEQQRVLGVMPAFNIIYRRDAASLTAGQKMNLAFRSAIDPFTFAGAFLVAGYHEALDEDSGFGWGPEGYFKRSGAAYLDSFDGTMIGNGFLPVILHQDPRYFRLGHGSATHRLLYAMATTVVCKHDNTGKWEPNYSNLGGNIIAGAISTLYYPSQESGIGETISNGLTVSAEGAAGAVFSEFWPDISRKLFHKDPTHGLDAQARAADLAAKQEKKENR